MKNTALVLTLSLGLASPASAYQYCSFDGSNTTCVGGYAGPSLADSYVAGLNVRARYAELNAYREAQGLPRCHYGILGAILSAGDGRPMC
jgi:hypothetical protein